MNSEPLRRAPPLVPIQPAIRSGVPKAEAPGTVARASQRELRSPYKPEREGCTLWGRPTWPLNSRS